jgi:hypothetical protein
MHVEDPDGFAQSGDDCAGWFPSSPHGRIASSLPIASFACVGHTSGRTPMKRNHEAHCVVLTLVGFPSEVQVSWPLHYDGIMRALQHMGSMGELLGE